MAINPPSEGNRYLDSEQDAHDKILHACRNNTFKSRGTWGMRTDVALGGYGTSERTPCVVLDLARTRPHPTRLGFSVPIVLSFGETWEQVLARLVTSGELPKE